MIKGLHVETMRRAGLHPEHEPHVVFQASTIGALLDGAYEGDVSFAELAEHGDLGLGTLDHLDGEMVALDGRFFRADIDGRINEVAPEVRTPFGVVVWFDPSVELELPGPLALRGALRRDRPPSPRRDGGPGAASGRPIRLGPGTLGPAAAPALPAAGRGRRRPARVRARRHRGLVGRLPLPRLQPGARGSRIPPALHLRRSSPRRPRSGLELRSGRARVDLSADLHVELPAGVDLAAPDLSEATAKALATVEREG